MIFLRKDEPPLDFRVLGSATYDVLVCLADNTLSQGIWSMIIFHQPPLFEGFARDLEDSVPTDAAAARAGG